MKKILTTALILGSLYGTANAGEIKYFVGADAGYNILDLGDKEKEFNYGLLGGLKYNANEKVFIGAEVHFRFGELFEEGVFWGTSTTGQDLTFEEELKNDFGAKIFIGYNINEKFNLSASAGIEHLTLTEEGYFPVDYDPINDLYTFARVDEEEKTTSPSFGLAAGFDINENISLKLSYDYIMYKPFSERIDLHTLRAGINYMF